MEHLRLNFMDEKLPFEGMIYSISCRNVIIIFDRATQERILGHIYRYLQSVCNLIPGHSETLTGMDLPLRGLARTIYGRV